MGCISAACRNQQEALARLLSPVSQPTNDTARLFPPGCDAPCFRVNAGLDSQCCDDTLGEEVCRAILENRLFNRTTGLALYAIGEALAQAGFRAQELAGRRVGLALGTTVGCTFHNEPYYLDWKAGKKPDPAPLLRYLRGNLAEAIQTLLGWQGPRAVVTNSCASGTDAIGLAKSWLELGMCDIAVAGGADELSRVACHGFHSLMLISRRPCRPFDRRRDGLSLGEGAGIMVLERRGERAQGRALGTLLGYGAAADAYHPTAPHPEGRGLKKAVRLALADAGAAPDQVAFINMHGTGTPGNDAIEAVALAGCGFSSDRTKAVSTKGLTGHTLGAAGGLEAVFTMLSLRSGKSGGTAGCEQLDDLPFSPVKEGESVSIEGMVGCSQSLAFGGVNSVLVMEAGR